MITDKISSLMLKAGEAFKERCATVSIRSGYQIKDLKFSGSAAKFATVYAQKAGKHAQYQDYIIIVKGTAPDAFGNSVMNITFNVYNSNAVPDFRLSFNISWTNV